MQFIMSAESYDGSFTGTVHTQVHTFFVRVSPAFEAPIDFIASCLSIEGLYYDPERVSTRSAVRYTFHARCSDCEHEEPEYCPVVAKRIVDSFGRMLDELASVENGHADHY